MSRTSRPKTTDRPLHGKVAFITGASSGIGAACAASFAQAGARLLLAARRNDRLQDMVSDLRSAGAQDVHTVALDVRDKKRVQAVIDGLPPSWQAIDVLINNAGLSRGLEKLYEGQDRRLGRDDRHQCEGAAVCHTRSGSGNGAARRRSCRQSWFNCRPHGLSQRSGLLRNESCREPRITEGLREDLLGTPVRVTTVDPGMVETEFSKVRFHGDERRAAKVYQGLTPLQAEDVADAILWAVTRPAHVNIAQVLMTSVDQANSLLFNRRTSD